MGPTSTTFLLAILCLLIFLPSVSAFGAGEIPDFAYLADKAFRHLDIENILSNVVRWKGSKSGESLISAAVGFLASGGDGSKFTKADVQRIYFGNWLRDYSQAMDISGLSNATADTILLLLRVLSFMTFGYATEEFELKAEKLGVYLPVEHIDNPKGYGGNEDPRKYHKSLRPPVDPRELEIDSRTGMKNYIANDGRGWDTSASHVRRSLKKAIQLARQSGGNRTPDLYEAYRLLGGALHTLEDLLAHSNWIELSLRKLGCRDVFCHVGEGVIVNAPGGQRVPPLVTGTFGSADFIFSLMGEAGDKLSESSVSELSKKVANAHNQQSSLSTVKTILGQVNSSGGGDTTNDIAKAEEIQKQAYNFDPDHYTTEEVQKTLWDILVWRDSIMRKVSLAIENIPGLDGLLEQTSAALSIYIFTTIEPYVKPVLVKVNDGLSTGSRLVIDQDDQYEVFDKADASDPSHSMLSKDHFDNILNEPAGKIAKVLVEVAVNKIVAAWSDNSVNADETIEEVIKALHHPYFADERCEIQMAMAQTLRKWYEGLGNNQRETISRLSKDSVRNHKNKRLGADDSTPMHSHLIGMQQQHSHGQGRSRGGYGQQQQQNQGQSFGRTALEGQRRPQEQSRRQSPPKQEYGGSGATYSGRRDEDRSYNRTNQQTQFGGGRDDHESDFSRPQQVQYGGASSTYGRRNDYDNESYNIRPQQQQQSEYGGTSSAYGRRDVEDSHNTRPQQSQYGGGNTTYGRKDDGDSYSRTQQTQYGGASASYGGRRNEYEVDDYHGSTRRDEGGYGTHHDRDDDDERRRKGYGSREQYHQQSSGRSEHPGGYGRSDERETSYGGARRDDHDSDDRKKYGKQQGNLGYGERDQREEGYGSGRGGSSYREDNNNTYGVENLNIGGGYGGRRDEGQGRYSHDDSDEEKRRKKHKKKDRDSGDSNDSDENKKKYGRRDDGDGRERKGYGRY